MCVYKLVCVFFIFYFFNIWKIFTADRLILLLGHWLVQFIVEECCFVECYRCYMYILQTVSVSALVPKCFYFISETESNSDCVIIIIITMVTKVRVPTPNTWLTGGDHVVHHAFIDMMILCNIQQAIMLYHNQFSSVQCKVVSMCLERPTCAPPCLSLTLPLNQFQCSSEWCWPALIFLRKTI